MAKKKKCAMCDEPIDTTMHKVMDVSGKIVSVCKRCKAIALKKGRQLRQ